MGDAAGDLARSAEHAIGDLTDSVASADARWLLLGVLLHLLNQLTRGIGWWAVIRIACPEATLRRSDTVLPWVAGAGAGGIVSARGGDAVRLLLLRPRMPSHGVAVLAGTLVAEAAGEAAVGAARIVFAVAVGVLPGLSLPGPLVLVVGAAAVLLVLVVVRRTGRGARVAQGAAALRCPGLYARRVLPWQLASRAARAAALACFLVAFGLPATATAVLLVMLAQGGGRVVPLAPASVGAGAAILTAGFGSMTGAAVDPARLVAFFVGTSAVLTVVGIALAFVICVRALGRPALSSPWAALRSAGQLRQF
jgi:uncharacterized membrane protein YbhN (UPF0104 family)